MPNSLTADDRTPPRPDPGPPAADDRGATPPPSEPRRSRPSDLHLIPIDPHRLFVHWWVAPETLADACRQHALPPDKARLALRLTRLGAPEAGERRSTLIDQLPADAGWHERFISLADPGGTVAGTLGIAGPSGAFVPLLTSLPVALPEAPAAAPAPLPAPAIDETAIVAAADRVAALPPELRVIPGEPVEPAPPPPTAAALPETPALDEHRIVAAALGPLLAAGAPEPARAAVAAPADQPGSSPARLASQVTAPPPEAPLHLHATLVISGRVRAGYRLRLGAEEIALRPDGGFVCRHRLDYFPAAWSVLLYAALAQGPRPAPSLELLVRLAENDALLTLDSSLELEGELRDASYQALLPPGVAVDAAGRFRLVRPVAAGALLLPHLVVIAADGAAPPAPATTAGS